MIFEYLIVGQGIAGSSLFLTLQKEKKSVFVIDTPAYNKSSRIAAGIINPVALKRLSPSWKAEELIDFAAKFYVEAETQFGKKFFFPRSFLKLFAGKEESEFWQTRAPFTRPYMSEAIFHESLNGVKKDIFGFGKIEQVANLDMTGFLTAVREHLKKNNTLLEEDFDNQELLIENDGLRYKNIKAKKLIFCEGYKATANPLFIWLPFNLTKGEILTIKADIETNDIYNKGVFLLPLGNNIFKAGTTYNRDEPDDITSEMGKNEILTKLQLFVDAPVEVLKHEAGIRPTVVDRRPLLGTHPQHPAIAIFNGMGSKGVMLAPFFAKQLIDHLENGVAIDPEADIKRFKKLN